MGFAKRYAEKRVEKDPEFKNVREDLVKIRNHELRAQLIELRLSLGLTQKEFADRVGVQQSVISRLENGNQNITIDRLQSILAKTGTGARLKIETEEKELIKH
ncbi:hypothetical protein GCM10022378_19720 [Salinicoccus jeotgali]|uniref:HTH cro/C1-type domain-containing protein n=1 Tax=Salinicoccus jeotgali TaxID=381634 RepID=A0ABP7F4R7_9STAP